jgi:REP element-mobilizing transposase RayT
MARPIINREKGAFYHAMIKTAHDDFHLIDKDDLLALEAFIVLYKEVHKIKIFCLSIMSNHLHILLQNSEEDSEAISLFFRDFKREFAKYYNFTRARKGPFWKERITAKTIYHDSHFVNSVVYILNNPVWAKKCSVAWDYAFSSFHLPMTTAAFNTLKQKINFMKKTEAFNFIRKIKKNSFFGCRSKTRTKTQNSKLSAIDKSFATALTDPFPRNLAIDKKTLRKLCLIKSRITMKNPFKYKGQNIIFESSSKKACFQYQKTFTHLLPAGALQKQSVTLSPSGTWQIIICKGRPQNFG